MSDIPFKAGDVVRLKSSGPRMTVTQVGLGGIAGNEPTVWCVWFDGQKKFEETFTPEALELAIDRPLPTSANTGRGRIRPTSF